MEPGGEGGREAQNTGIMEIKSHPCAADPRHIELSGRLIHARDSRHPSRCLELNLACAAMSNAGRGVGEPHIARSEQNRMGWCRVSLILLSADCRAD